LAVRPEGANHQWRRNPPRELSIDLEAGERLGRVTGRLREVLSEHDQISRVVKPYIDCWLVQRTFSQKQQFVTGAVISYRLSGA